MNQLNPLVSRRLANVHADIGVLSTSCNILAESSMDIEYDGEACTIPAVVKYIKDVKNVRALGLFLKIKPGRLDEIKQSTSGGTLIGIVLEWFKSLSYDLNDIDRWKELHRVLLEPAVDEPVIAGKLPVDSASLIHPASVPP